MRIVSEDWAELTQTIATTFEGLDISDILNINNLLTAKGLHCRPFQMAGHALQMKRDVYDLAYDTVHYIIEKIYRDEDDELVVIMLEHTEGGYNYTPETIEWTFPLDEVVHDIVGRPRYYSWEE